MCVHAPEQSLKDFVEYPPKWHPNRFVSRGWLRNSSPRGVLRQLLFWLLYVYIIIYTYTERTYTILTFFILCCIRLLFILFSMAKMCYFVHAAASIWRFLDGFFLFDFKTQNPPPYKIVRLYLTATNGSVNR